MIALFVLQTICDLAVYMMFASMILQIVFEVGVPSLMPFLILSAVASFSFLLFKVRPWLRHLPILLLLLCLFWMHNMASVVLLSLPCAYIVLIIILKKLDVEPETQRRRIKRYAKIVFFPLVMIFTFGYEAVVSFFYFHYLFIYLACAIGIMRLSRSGGKNASNTKFILINTGVVIGCLALLSVIGMPQTFGVVLRGARFLLVSLRNMFSPGDEPVADNDRGVDGILPEEEFELEPVTMISGPAVLILIGAVLIAIIVFFLVSDFEKRDRDGPKGTGRSKRGKHKTAGISEIRDSVVPILRESRPGGKQGFFAPRDPRMAVRHHYRQFLKMCAKKGRPPEAGDTSKDVNIKNRGNFSGRGMHRLRELYIKARYSEHEIGKSDSAESGELVKNLRGAGDA